MAATNSSSSAFFIIAPLAPASRVCPIASAVPYVVRIRIFASGHSARMRLVDSVPSMMGIMRSMTRKENGKA